MARSITTIYDELIEEKQSLSSLNDLQPNIDSSQALLDDLGSTTRVSRWRLLIWLMAFAIYMHENILELLLSQKVIGTPEWYQNIALEFEYGVQLVLVNFRPAYANPNPANRLVKFAAVLEPELTSGLVFKVAKDNGAGNPAPLTTPEKTAFTYYMKRRRIAGTKIQVISQPADVLKLGYQIWYDPLIMNPDGSLILEPSVFPVYDAIRAYLKQLPFDGMLHLDLLTDVVQKVPGVKHAIVQSAHARRWYQLSVEYTDIKAVNGQRYNPEAGYLTVSTEPSETLEYLTQYVAA